MTINYKVFAAGDTLSANDVLTYLENQAVIKVDAASELPTLASTYPNVKVAYAADTDKVYVNDDGTYVALVTADGTVTLSNLTLTGNLTVQGTTTTIDSTTIAIKDKFVFEGSTADAHETTLQVVEPTADRTISLPDSSGTVALTSDIPSLAGYVTETGTQTLSNKTINGSNNTISNVSLTSGVTGTLPVGNGGIGTDTVAQGQLLYGGGSNTIAKLNIGAAGRLLAVNAGGTAPEWITAPIGYSLPSQTGNAGKLLTTNGTSESWSSLTIDEIQIIKVMDYL